MTKPEPDGPISGRDRRAITVVGGLVGLLSGVAQFLSTYVHSGLQLLLTSGVVVAVGLLATLLIARGWSRGRRKVMLSINFIVLIVVALVTLGLFGGWAGHKIGVYAFPSPTPTATSSGGIPMPTPSNFSNSADAGRLQTITYTVVPQLEAPGPVPNLTLHAGEILRIEQTGGSWMCDPSAGPSYASGIKGADVPGDDNATYLVPGAPLCSLIGKIGDGSWLPLGSSPQISVSSSGSLYLTVNDTVAKACNAALNGGKGCYEDNSGIVTVRIIVEPQ